MLNTNKYCVVFPGQGAQRPGMGADFVEKYPVAAQVFDAASEAIGEDMRQLCFTENPKLDSTEFTQPAILTCSIAMYEVMRTEFSLKADHFGGHSLGEYSALVAAEAIPLPLAVQIVRKRGALMQGACPMGVGKMAAVVGENLDIAHIESLATQAGAEIANRNSINQVVLSGKAEAVEKAAEKIKADFLSVEIIFLNVSAPFHSSLMQPIEAEFKAFLKENYAQMKPEAAARVVSNYSGVWHKPETLIENLTRQISGSVRWMENMKLIAALGLPVMEIGPNKPLTKFFASAGVEVKPIISLRSLRAVA